MKWRRDISAIVLLTAFVGGSIVAPAVHQFDEGAAYEAHLVVEQLVHEGHEHDGLPAAEKPHDLADSHATCSLCLVRVNHAATDPGYSPAVVPAIANVRAAFYVPTGMASRQNYVRGPPPAHHA